MYQEEMIDWDIVRLRYFCTQTAEGLVCHLSA